MMWMPSVIQGNRHEGKMTIELHNAHKWTRGKMGLFNQSSYHVAMEEWIIVKSPSGEWWLKNKGSCAT